MNDTTNMTTRPFDMKLARIGAPYITRSGKKATILKWDCNHDQFPLAGVFGERDEPKRWRADGGFGHSHGTFAEDLVMAPLGLVEGRPFFCGDIIVGTNGATFLADQRDVDGDHASWHWPTVTVHPREISSALETLRRLGYTDCGGELWRPPIGLTPQQQRLRDAREKKIAQAVFKAMRGVIEVSPGQPTFVLDYRPLEPWQIEIMITDAIAGVDQ